MIYLNFYMGMDKLDYSTKEIILNNFLLKTFDNFLVIFLLNLKIV